MTDKSDPEFTRLLTNQLMNAKGFYDWGIKRGLTTPDEIRLAIWKRVELAREYKKLGKSEREIAKLTGVSRTQVRRDLGLDLNGPENGPEGTTLIPFPDNRYSTVVIDPPWEMEKIERQVAPNQWGFDYPVMTEEALADFPVPAMALDDCHLFCWTTQKFLPAAFRLIDKWGFKYIFLMTWHKSGGFQPFGLPQYNSEFVLYGRRGSIKFTDTQAFNACFQAERREHSRKPDSFYDTVKRVTQEPRIDVFSREKRDGFDQYGNEVTKFDEAVA